MQHYWRYWLHSSAVRNFKKIVTPSLRLNLSTKFCFLWIWSRLLLFVGFFLFSPPVNDECLVTQKKLSQTLKIVRGAVVFQGFLISFSAVCTAVIPHKGHLIYIYYVSQLKWTTISFSRQFHMKLLKTPYYTWGFIWGVLRWYCQMYRGSYIGILRFHILEPTRNC